MTNKLQYALILNPAAGRGKGARLEEFLRNRLKEAFGEAAYFRTHHPNHAREIAQHIRDEYHVIIAAGGDGTVHEVVNGMVGGRASLAVIPIGSGNDFVKMLNLPLDPEAAIQVIRNNRRMKIDIGKVGEEYFPNGLGIGFDAWVVKESSKVKRLRGFLIYLYSVIKTIFIYRNEPVEFHANGEVRKKDIFLIAVGNGVAMGGGFYLTPDARINDGLFDVCIIHALKKREAFQNLPKAINGSHTSMGQVEMLRTDRLKIVSDKGIAAHADGELLGMELKELDISLQPAALEVIYHPTAQGEAANG